MLLLKKKTRPMHIEHGSKMLHKQLQPTPQDEVKKGNTLGVIW